jgi:hypothetical protein
MNKEQEMMRNEAVVAYFRVLYRNLLGGTEDNHENLVKTIGLHAEI